MMTQEEFSLALEALTEMEFIKSHTRVSEIAYSYEMYVNVQEKTLTQLVVVTLINDTHVMAYSQIGPCPDSADTLRDVLAENMDGCHTCLAVFDGDLVQVYRYPLEFLEAWEMFKALDELSQLASFAQRKYFPGA